ncbi:pancreatic lipase-related protein 3-like [Asterias rubens]|uniref:pancreatic lipase-related protein 3-like n=1 Tax=Asterias rubens TaxID=7604 RepID=UPI0014550D82|nr:pancreatic lipase-related protein 3-like [Asterias rubens]
MIMVTGVSADESDPSKGSWLGDWGPTHWLQELCHWAGLCDRVCFGDLGCFSDDLPCHKDFFPPMTPAEIGTRFTLYTRHPRNLSSPVNGSDFGGSWRVQFEGRRRSVFIIHGWGETDDKQWVMELKDALLDKEDVNIITVDWADGADELNYMKSVQNIRVVGREVANLIQLMQDQEGLEPSTVHLIGHSLGAHAAGYAGKAIRRIGRITGLDAAGPGFENVNAGCRLDRTDATFVDVIHTSSNRLIAGGAGIEQKLGHADFYPNGGHDQPGCKWWMIGCNHARSHAYFIQSVHDYCRFPALPCETLEDFKAGKCRSCSNGGCSTMGYNADRTVSHGSYYLKTLKKSPYCNFKNYRRRDKFRRQGSKNEIFSMKKGRTKSTKKSRHNFMV